MMPDNACKAMEAHETARKHELRYHDWLWKQREPLGLRAAHDKHSKALAQEQASSERLRLDTNLLGRSDLLTVMTVARETEMPEDANMETAADAWPTVRGRLRKYGDVCLDPKHKRSSASVEVVQI